MSKVCYQFKHENVRRVLSACFNKNMLRKITDDIELAYVYISNILNLRRLLLYVT